MSIKSLFLSLSFVFVSTFSFAGSEVQPLDAPTAIVYLEAAADCTVNATFSSGGNTYEVTVTASDCAAAIAGLAAISKAIDGLE